MLFIILLAVFSVVAYGDVEKEKLSLDWIFNPANRVSLRVPTHFWLQDGTAFLYDRRVAPENLTIERFVPETGHREPAVNAEKILTQLKTLLGDDAKAYTSRLSWPEAFDLEGKYGLYLFQGDVFLMDIRESTVRRLTKTEAEEQCLSVSPDGSHIGFVRENNLYAMDLKTGLEKALTSDGSDTLLNGTLSWVYWEEIFGRRDTAYWWSPDSKAVAFLQTDESMVDVSVFPDYEPATPKITRQRYPKAGSKNPMVRVGIIEIESGKVTWAELGESHPEYVVRVTWLPHSRTVGIQTLNRKQNRLELLLANRSTGKTRRILVEENDTSVNVHDDLKFIENGRKFIWSSERDGYNHLYLYDIEGRLVRRLTSGKWMVRASSGVAWVRGGVCAVDEASQWVYFTAAHGSPVAPNLYRVRLGGGKVHRVSSREGSHRISFSPRCEYYFDNYSNTTTLRGLFLHSAEGKMLRTVTPPAMERIASFQLQCPESLIVPADDGFPLPAQIIKPRQMDPHRKYPVIIFVYGGPSAPVVWNSWSRTILFDNILLENGYICFRIDNRSATGQSKILEDTAHGKCLSENEINDILAGVKWLKEQPFVDQDRIGVWGWSGGGSMTLQLMTHSHAFKAGIAVAAVTDFRYYDTKWAENILDTPQNNPDGYQVSAAANFAADLSGRLLLIHGTGDDNVHPQNVWRFSRELHKAGKLFEMMIYPLGTHGISNAQKHVYMTMLDFWKRNL